MNAMDSKEAKSGRRNLRASLLTTSNVAAAIDTHSMSSNGLSRDDAYQAAVKSDSLSCGGADYQKDPIARKSTKRSVDND